MMKSPWRRDRYSILTLHWRRKTEISEWIFPGSYSSLLWRFSYRFGGF